MSTEESLVPDGAQGGEAPQQDDMTPNNAGMVDDTVVIKAEPVYDTSTTDGHDDASAKKKSKKSKKKKSKDKSQKKSKKSKRSRHKSEPVDTDDETIVQDDEVDFLDASNILSTKTKRKAASKRARVKTEEHHSSLDAVDSQDYTVTDYTHPLQSQQAQIDEYIDPSLPYSARFAKRQLIERHKRKRPRGGELSAEQQRTTSQQFVGKMLYAASVDRENIKAGKPAIEKQNMINLVSQQLLRSDLIEDLLESHLLGAIRQWLLPTPDGKLVNLRIRSVLYPILVKLPIAQEHLRNSHLGQLLVLLAQHPDETLENRKTLLEIIHKWVRKMIGIDIRSNTHHAHTDEFYDKDELLSALDRRRELAERSVYNKPSNIEYALPRRPVAEIRDFVRAPKGHFPTGDTAQEDGGDSREASKIDARTASEGRIKDVRRGTIQRTASAKPGNLRLNNHRFD